MTKNDAETRDAARSHAVGPAPVDRLRAMLPSVMGKTSDRGAGA